MLKRAKDVTYTNLLVMEEGLYAVRTVATDMMSGTTRVSGDGFSIMFRWDEPVETLNDSLDS
ncbi:hypothetical protein [Streptomyces sp. NPDC059874]|uniref:hypothetical protein n=1 Tax=Streptomyces sp. NPDC059874 TaxID=3346983 RepID=UPI0036498E0C